MPDPGLFGLHEVFGSLAGSIIVQQQRLDREYLRDLDAFVECFRQAGRSALAAQFVPVRPVVQQVRVECGFSLHRTKENTFSVRLMNRVSTTRYVNSRSFETKTQVTVQRVPLPPAAKILEGNK